jgi:hypothetical protein
MQVNALFKKAAPAPAKTVKKTAAKPVVKATPVKKATAPVKKATAPVKKATTVRKAAPSKVAAKGDSKWYGTCS